MEVEIKPEQLTPATPIRQRTDYGSLIAAVPDSSVSDKDDPKPGDSPVTEG